MMRTTGYRLDVQEVTAVMTMTCAGLGLVNVGMVNVVVSAAVKKQRWMLVEGRLAESAAVSAAILFQAFIRFAVADRLLSPGSYVHSVDRWRNA